MSDWTSDVPTEPGFYWAISPKGLTVVQVEHETNSYTLSEQILYWFINRADEDPVEVYARGKTIAKVRDIMFWSGPIVTPNVMPWEGK